MGANLQVMAGWCSIFHSAEDGGSPFPRLSTGSELAIPDDSYHQLQPFQTPTDLKNQRGRHIFEKAEAVALSKGLKLR